MAATALSASLPVSAGNIVQGTPQSVRESSYPSLTALQGRQHPSYQVFASQIQLPSVVVLGNRILIDRKVWIDGTRLQLISWRQRQTLAVAFAVPIGVIEHWRVNLRRQAPLDGPALARDLCATVIDYHYLKARWLQYRPPSARLQKFKVQALLALKAGELDQAWAMYYSLSRPAAPAG